MVHVKWNLQCFFLPMVAMHGLLDFGTDKNAFVATGTFGFSVPLATLKKTVGSFDGAWSSGRGTLLLFAQIELTHITHFTDNAMEVSLVYQSV